MNFNQAARVSANPVKYGSRESARALGYFHEAKRTAITEQFKFECDIAIKRILNRIVGEPHEHIRNKRKPCPVCARAL